MVNNSGAGPRLLNEASYLKSRLTWLGGFASFDCDLSGLARSLASLAFSLGLSVVCSAAHAAITDCEGMSKDGQAQCIAPTYAPTTYLVCDIAGSFQYRTNAWNACYSELGVTSPYLSEETAIAMADCFDKKIGGADGGISGGVPWLPTGTVYDDNLCTSGTVRDVEGHHIWGVGNKSGASGRFAFTRRSVPSCPSGYTSVTKLINGFNELVRCKPNPPCPEGQVLSTETPQICLVVSETRSTAKPQMCPKRFSVGDPIYPLTGAMKERLETGFKLNGVELILTYDTTPKLNGAPVRALPSLGSLWSSSLHKMLGIGSGARVLTAYRGDGSVTSFALKAGIYVADSDVNDSVVAAAGGYQYVDGGRRQLETYNGNGELTRLDGADGSSLTFSYSTAPNAQAPEAGYLMQVTDNTGRFLKFEYILPAGMEVLAATRGLISRITDSAGRSITVNYDANQNVESFVWPDSNSVHFLYETAALPWAMTGRIDENGSRDATWSYNAQGQAVSIARALGTDAYSVAYGSPMQYAPVDTEDRSLGFLNRRYTLVPPQGISITTPNDQSTAWTSASVLDAPLLTGASQPAGSGCAAANSAMSYDAAGNVLSKDDFDGQRTCYAYDTSNRETVRVEGLPNNEVCAAVITAGASLPSGARKIITSWHPDWRIPTQVIQPLRTVTYVYQGRPDPSNGNQAATCTSAPALPNGKLPPLLCKQLEQATRADGSIDTGVAVRTTSYTYDAGGRLLTSQDANGRTRTYTYYADTSFDGTSPDATGHTLGDVQTVKDALGGVTQFTLYDKAGRVRQSVDPKGIVTDTTYTPRGQPGTRTVTPPGGTARVSIYGYDNTGQLISETQPDGTSLQYDYDEAHRMRVVTDARGNTTTYTLDTAGNRVSEDLRDAGGILRRTITREFDALNRVKQVRIGIIPGRAGSTLALAAMPNPTAPNQPVSLTVQVVGNDPTGTITFYDGFKPIASGAVNAGAVSRTVSFADTGPHTLTAEYSGDSSNAASVSDAINLSVLKTTTTALSVTPNPAESGSPVTLTAQVSGESPTGTVTFKAGTTVIGTAPVSGGTATLSQNMSPGNFQVTAAYSGDSRNSASTSAAVSVTVKTTVSMTWSVSPSTVVVDTATTLTATVYGSSPTGSVTFFDGSSQIGTATLSGRDASLTYSFPTSGSRTVTARYAGDSNNAPGSTSFALDVQPDNRTATATTFSCDDLVTVSGTGQQVVYKDLTCHVQVSPTATGTVEIVEGSVVLGALSVSGARTFYFIHIPIGTHTFTARYLGSDASKPSQASLALKIIDKITPTVSVSCPTTAPSGSQFSCSVNVSTAPYRGLLQASSGVSCWPNCPPTVNYTGSTGGATNYGVVRMNVDGTTQSSPSWYAMTGDDPTLGTASNATVSPPPVGQHSVRADFSGGQSLLPALSPAVLVQVQ